MPSNILGVGISAFFVHIPSIASEVEGTQNVKNKIPYPGFFYLWQKRYSDAEDSVKKAQSKSLASYGTEHPITFLNTIVLGMIYREQGRYDDAEEQLRSAVDFTREYPTDKSVMTAGALHELAVLYQKQGKYIEAERLHLEVLDIQRSLLVENHWHTLGTIRDLIALYTAWGKHQEAKKWFDVVKIAYPDQSAKFQYSSATSGTISYDRVMDTYTLVAPSSLPWTVEKELNFSLPEPSSDMWHICDDLCFAYKTLDGDGSITAKIESITPTHYATQVGLMIRSTLDPTSPNASVVVTPLGDAAFQYRIVELGATRSRYVPNKVKLPYWIRLTRKGNRFTAQHSNDGVNWQTVHNENSDHDSSIIISMAETVHIGLAISSSSPTRSARTCIAKVTITGLVEPDAPFVQSNDISLSEASSTTSH